MGKEAVNSNQPSITEWFAAIGEIDESERFRKEDNQKSDRLEILYQEIALPYEQPEPWPARALTDRTAEFEGLLKTRGEELCAIRLVPKDSQLPKLRNRGLSIRECYESWYLKQSIDPDQYTAYICPHSDELLWSAIFVVNDGEIFGEIIRGAHNQLTQGNTEEQLLQFRFDFKTWTWSKPDPTAKVIARQMVKKLKVTSRQQGSLENLLQSTFSHGYLAGYFETTVWPDNSLYFIDYNRLLPKFIPIPPPITQARISELHGTPAFMGVVEGVVVVLNEENLESTNFPAGSILVCDNTDIRYLPFMRQSAAIITNRGGILSHAAIIARELKKTCIIGTKTATRDLKTGDRVIVDGKQGTIRKK